jgi:hypothetical protein
LVLALLGLVGLSAIRVLPDLPAYRHWRVAQTKSIAGTPMTIDDIWWTRSSESHQSFLRVLCHWNNGFPPADYQMRARLLNADGAEIAGTATWYVPMPKTRFTPAGGTPFCWEFRTEPPADKDVRFRVKVDGNGQVDFDVPNVAVRRDMSCPDIFAPGALWTMNSFSGRPD